jgi:hypothetical protein
MCATPVLFPFFFCFAGSFSAAHKENAEIEKKDVLDAVFVSLTGRAAATKLSHGEPNRPSRSLPPASSLRAKLAAGACFSIQKALVPPRIAALGPAHTFENGIIHEMDNRREKQTNAHTRSRQLALARREERKWKLYKIT